MTFCIIGAGSGIGREVCRVFAREGANVVVTDQNMETASETIAILEGHYDSINVFIKKLKLIYRVYFCVYIIKILKLKNKIIIIIYIFIYFRYFYIIFLMFIIVYSLLQALDIWH